MKKIIASLTFTFLCTQLSAMEIEEQTKPSERTPLKSEKRSIVQKQTRNSNHINFYTIQNASNYGSYMAQLPKEVNAIIYRKLFEIDATCAKEFAKNPADILIRHFLQNIRPVILGNKKFGIVDMLKLSKEQRDQLKNIAEPPFINRLYGINNQVIEGHSFAKPSENHTNLKAMPSHITQNLEISMIGGTTSCISSSTRCIGNCGVVIGLLIGCIACIGGCDLCGIVSNPCISKPVGMILVKVMGGLTGSIPACECVNCLQIHCCPDFEKCDFSPNDKNGKIN